MRNYGGFSDRRGLEDGGLGDSGGAMPPDSYRPVVLVLNLLTDRPGDKAIRVCETSGAGVVAWLPRSEITVAPVITGRTVRVTMPLWLARKKLLATDVPEGQGELF